MPKPLVNHRIGPYTVDFLYPEQRLVIETDEDAHKTVHAFEVDRARDRHLAAHNYRVMRVTKHALGDPALAGQLRAALVWAPALTA